VRYDLAVHKYDRKSPKGSDTQVSQPWVYRYETDLEDTTRITFSNQPDASQSSEHAPSIRYNKNHSAAYD
jgi:hypothetical protein